MAYEIQQSIEESIPEVEDLLDRGILSQDEVKALVGKRRDFETRIHRFDAVVTDFLQYIEYELNIEKLTTKRKLRLKVSRSGVADHASIRRINLLFDKGLRKFKGNLDLWVAAIEFAQTRNSPGRLSKLLGSAIKLFPQNEGFWILAASHEFEENKNIDAARAIMLQALRVNPKSTTIWREYFKMEFLLISQVLERSAALIGEAEDKVPSFTKAMNVIFDKALSAVPKDVNFAIELLHVVESFLNSSAAKVAEKVLNEHVLDKVKSNFDGNPQVCVEVAKRLLQTKKNEDTFLKDFCKENPYPEVWEFHIGRLLKQEEKEKALTVCLEALAGGYLTEQAAEWLLDVLEDSGISQTAQAKKRRKTTSQDPEYDIQDVLRTLTKEFPQNMRFWSKLCEFDSSVAKIAVKQLKVSDTLPFWRRLIEDDPDNFSLALRTLSRNNEYVSIIEDVINDRLRSSNRPSKLIAQLESSVINIVPLGCFLALFDSLDLTGDELRNLYEMCIERYQDADIVWKRYIEFEQSNGDSKSVKQLLLRALAVRPSLTEQLKA